MPKAVLLLFVLGAAAAARAQTPGTTNRTVLSGLDLPGSSVALEDSPAASTVNPAGIGMQRGLSLRYLHEEGAGLPGPDGDGLYLGAPLFGVFGFGLSFEWLRFDEGSLPPHRRTSWSLAVGDPRLSLGVTAHVFSGGVLDERTSWDAGLLLRPGRALSVGLVARNLDTAPLNGIRPNREYALGVGLRPWGDWLTVAVDASVLGSENDLAPHGFERTAFAATLLWRLVPGVTVLGGYTHRLGNGPETALLGLRLDGEFLRVEGAPILRTEGDNAVGWVAGATLRTWRERSLGEGVGRTFVRVRLDEVFSSPSGLVLFGGEPRDPMVDAVEGLAALGRDGRVDGVVLEMLEALPVGMGNAWDLHRAILDLRARGKRVVAFVEEADDATYLVASAADHVIASPAAFFVVNGLASRADFFARTLDLIGVQVEAVRVGRYKSAPETFTRSSISVEYREVLASLLDDLFASEVAALARARGMDESAVREALQRGLRDAESARQAGLVDALAYHDALEDRVRQWAGRRIRFEHRSLRPASWEHWSLPPEIAVVPITGTIVSGGSQPFGLVPTTGDRSVIRALEEAAASHSVRAILLRIDSGGGDASASQRIWNAVREAARRKPVIAAMGDAGASGAYYAAVGADRIFATPATYTGSIGVFWLKPDLEGLMEKLRVGSHLEKRGEQADILSWRSGWTEGMRESIQSTIDSFYEGFLRATAEARDLSVEEVDAVAQGRVWTGAQARERALVDDLGGLGGALREARLAAGLPEDATVRFRVYAPSRSMLTVGFQTQGALDGPVVSLLQATVPIPILLWNGSGVWALSPVAWWVREPGRL
ncbi:MAG: signal peptide peptidase SppA [Pseudomonadota bacterium]|nr:MAG: signal peptide peptidase SppA [Pseudomonadota bacterium]